MPYNHVEEWTELNRLQVRTEITIDILMLCYQTTYLIILWIHVENILVFKFLRNSPGDLKLICAQSL